MTADGTAPRLIRIPGPLAGGVWAASAAPASFRPALTGDTTGLRLAADPNGALRLDCADGSLGRLTLPLGVAIDHDRRVYLLDPQRGLVLRHDPGAPDYDPARPFTALAVGNHPPSDPAGDNPRRFTGATAIAVDRDSLYVADAGSGRVLVFALGSWALRDVWRFPGRERPWDVAVARAGVFVLTPHRAYLWRPGDCHPRPVVERPGGPLWYWSRLAADRDDRLYLLTRRPDGSEAKLLVYDSRRQELLPEPVAEAAVRDRFPPPPVFTLPDEGHGDPQYVMPEPLTRPCGREWPGPLPGRPIESYLTRAPRPEGGFVFDARGDLVQREAVRPTRTRLFRTGAKPPDDPWISQRLDSRLFDCRWDLVELEFGDLPPGCRAELSTFTTNEELPSEQVWREPEAAWAAGLSVTGPPRAPTSDPNVTTDFLVGGPPGRYLWLRVRFRGDGFATPVLRAASVRFPRRSYLEHLPAVFSEDEAGRRFLEQFLAVFQTEWDRLEFRADGLADLFDPRGVPDSQLDYLAGWLGARFENGWTAAAKRRLLARLPSAYFAARRPDDERPVGARRGTPAALRDYVAAVLAAVAGVAPAAEGFPLVIESFRDRDYQLLPARAPDEPAGPGRPLWGPAAVGRFQLGVASRLDGERLLPPAPTDLDVFATHAHRFRVVIPAAWVPTPAAEAAVRQAVDGEKPAHTGWTLQLVRPGLRVGVQSTVGVDTILGGGPSRLTADGPRLGADAVLAPPTGARPDAGLRLGTGPTRG